MSYKNNTKKRKVAQKKPLSIKPLSIKLSKIARAIRNIALASSVVTTPGLVMADPSGGAIGHDSGGGSNITPNVGHYVIDQTGNSLYIDWTSFDLANGEFVTFNQPSSTAVALNNISGGGSSSIAGTINANGRIFLINPDGIVFGNTASINVNGLIASSLLLSEADFAAGNYVFTNGGQNGNVTNEGTLTAGEGGFITLLGHDVSNAAGASILATKSQANLISAEQVTFNFSQNGLLQFTVDQAVAKATAVSNAGSINATDGWVVMSAQSADNIIANTVNNTGILTATGVDTSTGEVYLVGGNGSVGLGQVNSALLNVSANGHITSGDGLNVSGTATLDSGNGHSISVNNAGNNFGSLSLTGVDATVTTGSAVNLSGVSLSGHLSLTTNGAITDTGAVGVGGVTTLITGDNSVITLDEAANDFATITIASTGDSVILNDINDITLATINATNLSVATAGNITQSADLTVSGNANFAATGADVLLNTSSNNFGSLSLSGVNAAVTEASATDLSGATLSGNLNLMSAGAISDSGTVKVAGNTTLSTANNSTIALNDASNDFTAVTVTSTGDSVELVDANTLDLGAINATSLAITAVGDITQSSALTTSGNASFNGANVLLNTQTNNFGSLSLAGGNAVVLEGSSTDLNSASLSGNLDLTSIGAITDSGTVSVAGITTLNTGNGSTIALNDGSNDFATVTVASTGDSVELVDVNNLNLGGIDATDLTVTATGNVTQAGGLTISGNARFTGADVLLNTDTNNFGSLTLAGGNAAVAEASSTDLSGVSLSGSLDLTSTGAITDSDTVNVAGVTTLSTNNNSTIALDEASNDFGTVTISSTGDSIELIDTNAVILGAINSADLTVTATGNISQSGALTTSGNARFNGADVLLNTSTNNFASLTLTAVNAAVLEGSSTDLNVVSLSGNFDLTSAGAITDSGTVSVDGISTLSTGNDSFIALNDVSNDFGTVAVTSTGDSIELIDTNSVILGAINSADLIVTATGNISQSGALTTSGNARFNGADVLLNTSTNNFGSLTLTAVNAAVLEGSSTDLNGVTLSGNFDLASTGAITDSDRVSVDGITTLSTGNDSTIALNDGNNDFATVAVTSTGDSIELINTNSVILGAINSADLTVTATGNISQSGALTTSGNARFNGADVLLNTSTNNFGSLILTAVNAAVLEGSSTDLSSVSLSGNFGLTSSGAITDSGTVSVVGITTLSTGNDSTIALNDGNNDFATVAVTSTGDSIELIDTNSVILGAINSADLAVTATGNISQSGALTTSGNARFNGADVLLNSSTNNFGSLTLTAVNAAVLEGSSTDLSSVSLSGDFGLTSSGAITDSGTVSVDGVTTLSTNDNSTIALDDASNDFGTVTVTSTGDSVALIDVNTVNLGAINSSSLAVTATGGISQSGALATSGNASFNGVNVSLSSHINNFGSLALTGGNAAVLEGSSTDLSAVTLSGNFDLTSSGAIADSGAVSVAGVTTLNTGNGSTIALNDGNNDFATVAVTSTGDSIELIDTNGVDLGAINSADLIVTATGNINQSGALTTSGNARFSGADILLNTRTNNFGSLSLAGVNATVTQGSSTDLSSVMLSGNLDLTSIGAITDSGTVNVVGVTTLSTGNGSTIALNDASNDFGTVTVTSTGDSVTLIDANTINLGAINSTSLAVTAVTGITQSGALTTSGNASFNGADVSLSSHMNNFGNLSLTGGNAAVLEGSSTDLNSVSLSGNLDLTSSGAIADSGTVRVVGVTTLNTGNNSTIALNDANNDFGTVTVVSTGDGVELVDANGIILGAMRSNSLTVSSAGDITNSGALVVSGNSAFNNGSGTAITLDHAGNDFANVTVAGSGDTVTLVDSNDIDLGAITASNLAVTTAGNIVNSGALVIAGTTTLNNGVGTVIALDNAANNFATVTVAGSGDAVTLVDSNGIDLGAMNVASLTVTAAGDIINSGALVVSGITTVDNGVGSAITLTNAANNFGTVTINGSGDAVTLVDADGIILGGMNATSLDVTAAGNITQSGALVVSGNTQLSSNNAQMITLDDVSNNFTTVSVGSTGDSVTLRDADSIVLGAINAANLDVTAAGNITQSDGITTTGNARFAATNINLNTHTNDFLNLSLSGVNATVTDNSSTNLSAANLSGDLTLTSTGDITDSGPLVVSGTTTLSSGNSITLDEAANDFATVTVASTGNTVVLNDINTVNLGPINAMSLTVTAGTNITQSGDLTSVNQASFNAADVTLNSGTNNFGSLALTGTNASVTENSGTNLRNVFLSGALTLTSAGDISNSAAVSVAGVTSLNNGVGTQITLDHTDNDFGTVTVVGSGDAVVLHDSNTIDLGSIDSTDLTVTTAAGNITQSDDLTVSNNASFSASGADVLLNTHTNRFAHLALTANTATVSESGDTNLNGVTATTLNLTSTGNITDSAAVVVTGVSTFGTAGNGLITLNDVGNNFGSVIIASVNDSVVLSDVDGIELGQVNAANLQLSSNGSITNSGALTIAGTTTLNTSNNQTITLGNANDFNILSVTSSGDSISINDINAIDLGSVNAANLTVTAATTIRQSGNLITSGNASFSASDVQLSTQANSFANLALTATNASVTETDAINLHGVAVTNLTLVAGGTITNSAAVVATGTTTLTSAGNSLITLDHADNNFATVSVLSNGDAVVLNDSDGIDLAAINAASLNISANGAITDSGALIVAGTTTLNTSNNQTITLDNANDFNTLTVTSTGDSVTLNDINAVNLATLSAADLTVTAAGNISQSGNLNVTNNASFSAADVSLNQTNNFGALALTANNATVTEAGDTELNGVNVTNLSLTSGGAITDSGAVVVTGTTSLTAANGAALALDHTANNFSTVTIGSTGNEVTLADVDGIDLGAMAVASLNLSTNGGITNSGALSISGALTLATGNNASIVLDDADNDFTTVSVTSTGDTVVLNDKNAINLAGLDVASLSVTSAGDITDSGALVVSGLTTLQNSGSVITLDHGGNNFANVSVTSSGNIVELNDTNGIDLATMNAASLKVTANGAITDSGALIVAGTTTLNTSNNQTITLDNDNDFASVTITSTGDAVVLKDINMIDLGAMNVASLSLTTGGAITDSGTLAVSGALNLATNNGSSITLDDSDNDFDSVTVNSTGDSIVLIDKNALGLAAMTAKDLSVTAGGNITQSGNLAVTNNASFTGADVNLTTHSNNFGSLALFANNASVTEASSTDLSGATINGNLTLTSVDNIIDSGAVVVTGTTTLDSGNGKQITLDHSGNDFGTVALASTGDTVVINDSSALDLGAMNTASLNVTAGGAISNSGALVVSGLTTLNSGNNAAVTLNNVGNDFSSVTVSSTGNSVVLNDLNEIELGTINAASLTVSSAGNISQSGALTTTNNASFTATNGDILLNSQTNQFGGLALTGSNATVIEADSTDLTGAMLSGTLALTANGNISGSGAVMVAGLTTLNTGNGGSITLDHASNNFATVTVASTGDSVVLTDFDTIDLGVINSADLTVTAGTNISQSGDLTTLNNASFNATAGNVNLTTQTNNFGRLALSALDATVIEASDTDLSGVTANTLTLSSAGDITGSGAVAVAGVATLTTANNGLITLDHAANNLATVTIGSTGDTVVLNDSDAIDLGAMSIASLNVTAAGNITNSGALVVAGQTTLNSGNGALITLDNAANDFTTVTVASTADTVVLNDINTLDVAGINAAGLAVTAAGDITQSGNFHVSGDASFNAGTADVLLNTQSNTFGTLALTANNAIVTEADSTTLNGVNIASSFTLTSADAISDTAAVVVAGTSILSSGNNAAITLDHADNDFATVGLSSTGNAVTLSDSNSINLGDINAASLNISAVGAIADVGTLLVSGATTLRSSSNQAIVLDSTSNDFASVSASGGSVLLNDINAIELGAVSATDLTVNVNGNITQTGELSVTNNASFSAGLADIVLNSHSNNFGTLSLAASNAAVSENSSIDLKGATIGTDLTLTAAGNITDDGAVVVAGVTTLNTGNAAAITLDDVGNDFTRIAVTSSADTIVLNDINAIELGAMNAAALSVTATTNITDSGAIVVAGATTLNGGDNAQIILDDVGNDFATLSVTSTSGTVSGSVVVNDVNSIELASINAATLDVTAGTTISQSGDFNVSDHANFSGSELLLNTHTNNFGSLSLNATNAQVTEASSTDLTAVTITNDFTLSSVGEISDSGSVNVAGLTTLSGTLITLDTTTNDFGTVAVTGATDTVTLVDTNAIDLGPISATNLTISAGGDISDSGNLLIADFLQLSGDNQATIVLDQAGNNFNRLDITSSGNSVTVVDVDSIELAALTAADLTVTAGGNISQSGDLSISNNASFTSATADVLLNTHQNTFASLSLNGNNATVTAASSIDLTNATIASDLTLTSVGNITDSGTITVAGLTRLNSGNNATIALDSAGNNFTTVSVGSTGDAVTLVDVDNLDLATMNAANLKVSTGGLITDSGSLVISGLTILDSGNDQAITLDQAGNDFATVSVTSTGDSVVLTDVNAIELGALTAASLNVTAAGNISQSGVLQISDNATFTTAAADVLLNTHTNNFGNLSLTAVNAAVTEGSSTQLNGITTSGAFTLTAAGDITDTAAMTVAGVTSLNTGNNATIVLDEAGNNFTTVTVASSGDSVNLVDSNAVNLGAANAQNLTVVAAGNITQSGALQISNNASFTATGADISLNTQGNNFANLLLTGNNATVSTAGNANLSGATIAGDLSLTTAGNITDSGIVNVSGLTTLNSGNNSSIVLDSNNDFSTITVTSSGDTIVLNDANTLDLGAINAASLEVSTNGNISDSGTLTVAGLTRLNSGNNSVITLDQASNNFATLTVASLGDTVSLNDINGIVLGGMNAASLAVDAAGTISQSGAVVVNNNARFTTATANVDLNTSNNNFGSLTITANNAAITEGSSADLTAVNVNGNLTLTAAGNISDSGTVTVAGITTLNSGNNAAVILDSAGNNFSTLAVVSSGDTVVVNDVDSIVLGTLNATDLTVTAAANISQSGNLNVANNASFNTNTDVLLDTASNNFGSLLIAARGAQINEADATDLNSVNLSGDLSLNSTGAITDSGNVTVLGNTTLDTGGNSAITLDNSNNDFNVVTIASVGDAVTLSDINTVDFGTLNAASLNVTTAGDITDSGTIVVSGETRLNSGDDANIVFDDEASDFGSVTIASSGDTVVLNDINAIELGGMVSESLSVNAAGDITQSGELLIDNNASFTSTGEVLLNDNNNFGTLSLTAVAAQITEASGADLNGVNLEGDFSLTAAGDITNDGAIVVGGITTLDSGGDSAITLDDADNDFASITITSSGDAVVLNDINAIDLAAINAASLSVSSDGAITSSGALVISGNTSLNSGNDQLITLDNLDNDFNSLNIASTGDIVVINNINAIELATINAAALDVTAGGDISQSGDVNVTDHASFTATNADVLLDSQTNNFGSLSLSANNASVTEADDIDLTAAVVANNLRLSSAANITGSGIISVGQNTTLNTANNSTITLNNAANDFATVTITSTGDTVQLTDVNAIDLGAMDTASLSVNAQGNITDSGAVIVAGVATLNSGNNALITLDDAANNFNNVAVTSNGDTIILNDINEIELSALNAAAVDVTTAGDISQTGDFTVTGNASFTASNANVLLNTQTNNFGSLSLTANQALVSEASSTDLASVLVSDLHLTSAGNITDSGTLKITGLTTLDSGDGKVITLDGSDNDFNTVTLLSTGDNVTLNDSNGIDLGAMNVASLDLKTAGNISDSGVVAVSGLTTLTTSNNASIVLDQANDFNTVVVASSGDSVVLNDVDGIELGSITAAGLNVTAGGDISQSGNLAVSGDAAFITPTADVQLNNNSNTFGTLAITAVNATVDEDDDTVLNGVAVSNDLRLTSSGSIDDTAALTVGGQTWLKSDRDITLDQTGNDFNTVTVTSTGNSVTLTDSNEIELGAMNVASLTVTSAGSITNTGALQVSGVTSLNTGNDSQITLDGENDFATVTIASTGDTVVINDINAIDLGVMNANTLDVTAVGNISQSGALLVSNNARFNTDANLLLGDNSNNFGDLTLSANDATVSEGSAMTLTDVTATNLTLSAAGDISDTGKLLVSGVTTLNSGNNAQIILDGSENNLGTVTLSSTGDTVVLNDVDAIELGAMNASSLSVTATGDITQTADALVIGANANFNTAADVTLNSSNQFNRLTLTANNASVTAADAIDLNGVTVTNLTLASGGAISDSGTLLVSGVATFGSGNNAAITLDDASNNFGTVTVNTQGNAVTLNDVDTIELGQITAASLTVIAAADITQTANLVIGGNANFATATDVTLTGANQFGTVSVSANNVNLIESGDAELAAVVVAGDLTLTTSGDITDSGIVSVAGITRLNSGNGAAITLDNAGNDFSTVIVTSTADAITLNDSNTLDLGALNAASLNVTTAGAITDSGTLLVSGVTTLNSGNNAAITLDDAANNFATVTVASNGDSVLLNDVDGITLGQIAAADLSVNAAGEISQSGNLTVTNGATFSSQAAVLLNTNNNDFGNLTITADSASINEQSSTQLNGITIANDLTVTSGSDISQSDNISVAGNANFIAATGDVVLNSNTNDFGSLSVTAINATIDENSSTSLNGVTVTADLTLNSIADISQVANSAIDVAGNANFITVADVTLNSGANVFGSISANANNITISETDGSDLNGITALTNFSLNSGANINQTAASTIEVGSNASLTTANNITLAGNSNNFGSLTLAAADASIVESSDTVLDAVAVANLTLTSVGNISQTDSSGIRVTGNANFDTPADVILANIIANNNNDNSFGSLTINAANATIEEADSSELNGIEISADFSLTAGGDIIQTDGGNINVAGNAGFTATGDVTLATNNNTFGSLSLDAVNATIDEDDATELNNVTVNGEFVLASAGDITQTVVASGQARTIDQLAQGQVNVTGSATFTTASDVVLANSINDFGSLTLTAANATISEASDSVLNAINVTHLTINAQGDISQTAAIVASGVTTLNSGNGNTITLSEATNDFGTLSVVSTGDTVTVVDSNTLDLGLITSADLTVTAQDITQSNDVTVVGDITLAANNTVALTNIDATGNIAVRTETAGISTNGTVTSGGTIELDSNTAISANGALTAGGSITLAASDGDIAVTTVAGDTVDIVALRGNVSGSQIHATSTTEGETANMQILAVQVGDGDGLELLVETGAATVAVGNINSTTLVDNQESRSLLVQVFDSAAIDTARTATTELITTTLSDSTSQGNTAAGIAATDAGRSSEVVETKEDTLGGDESDYITPDPSVELPADQKEEDEFAEGDDE